jgi:hypothetical protein
MRCRVRLCTPLAGVLLHSSLTRDLLPRPAGTASEDGAHSDACTDFSSASTSTTCSDTASSSQDDLQSDSGDLQSDSGDLQSDSGDPDCGDASSIHIDTGSGSDSSRCSETASTVSEGAEELEGAAEGAEEGGRQLREVCSGSDTASEGAEDGRQLERACSSPRATELEEAERQAQELVVQKQQLMQVGGCVGGHLGVKAA